MESIPTLHKAGSAESTSQRVSSSKIDNRGSASSTSFRKAPSRIPTATRRVSSSTDGSFTDCSSLSTIRSPKGKQRAQENSTDDSELIQEIKILEGYKAKAISAEKQTTSLVKENNNLRNEVEALRIRSDPLENEIKSLRHNLGEYKIRLGEQERQRANQKKRADGLASELEIIKAQKDTLITKLRYAEEQLKASQSRLGDLTQQLEAEKAARKKSEVLQSQLDPIAQKYANLQQELQEQLAGKQKYESELEELRSAHQQERRQKLEVENLYTEVLAQRNDLELRCTELHGLVESMRRFGKTLVEIKQCQQDTNAQIATLNGNTEEVREQLRGNHLDMLGQYRLHIDNIREFEVNYIDRRNVLEGHITTLQELIDRNNDSQETYIARKASLIDRLEEFLENNNRPKDDILDLDKLRHRLAEATAAMNVLCSQQNPQAEHQELSPPSSPITAISSSQATDKEGQRRFGWTRRKGELESQA
ncbi:hypothetical protein BDW69DRAFT_59089 [Aspergillus filifer]